MGPGDAKDREVSLCLSLAAREEALGQDPEELNWPTWWPTGRQ